MSASGEIPFAPDPDEPRRDELRRAGWVCLGVNAAKTTQFWLSPTGTMYRESEAFAMMAPLPQELAVKPKKGATRVTQVQCEAD